MNSHPNHSTKFRTALKQELSAWVQDGILSEESAAQLRQLYQLDQLEKESSRLLAAVLFTLGSLLLGGGIISFVAAHWEELPPGVKVVLLFAALLGFHLTGYWLRYERKMPRLGHALIFCGCLVFGANIGLMAQIFHVSGDWYRAYAVWAVGVLAMAWAVRSWLCGVLAQMISYVWFVGFIGDHHERLASVYPFLLATAFLPLAWQTGSRVLCTLTLVGIISALTALAGSESDSGTYALLALAAGGLVSWAAGEYHRAARVKPEFGNPLAMLGVVALAGGAYVWSFHWIWQHRSHTVGQRTFYWLISAGVAVLIAVVLIGKSWSVSPDTRLFSVGILLALLLIAGAALLSKDRVVWPTIVMNLSAFLLAAIGIGKGFTDQRRLPFWAGTLFLVLLILSRFFEYETGLLLKSAAFVACGALVLFAGMTYERRLQRREVTQ